MQWGTEAPAYCQEKVPSLKWILLQSSFQMKAAPADINYSFTKYPEPKPPSKLLLNSCQLI